MSSDPIDLRRQEFTRRHVLGRTGLGAIALSSLINEKLFASSGPPAMAMPHHPPRAKAVIAMHMVGAPSQIDLLDPKPVLKRHDGQLCPKEFIDGKRFAFLRGHPKLLASPYAFARCGQSGLEISELLPHIQTVADEIAVVRSVHTEEFNHAPAQLFFQTGFGRFGRPPLGAWISYGLGSENRDLPAFIVLNSGALIAGAGSALWGSGFLPTVHQGVELRKSGDPVLFLSNPRGIDRPARRRILDSIHYLNEVQLADVGDPEIATRIAQYELAFRMQASVPELADFSDEPPQVLEMYGATPGQPSFANNCLLARRLVERGVRFVQLYDSDWDHHADLTTRLPAKCRDVDQPIAALIRDLKSRGLLDETLVIWGGEFGRTPMLQGEAGDEKNTKTAPGRDHHKEAFSVLLAGGGVRGGATYGQTDELGYSITADDMHINDLHATILHLLGLDHEKLTFRFQGRAFRLTDVAGHVARRLLA